MLTILKGGDVTLPSIAQDLMRTMKQQNQNFCPVLTLKPVSQPLTINLPNLIDGENNKTIDMSDEKSYVALRIINWGLLNIKYSHASLEQPSLTYTDLHVLLCTEYATQLGFCCFVLLG